MSKGSFLERWSRRKLGAGEADEPQPGPDQDSATPPETEAVADPPVEETLDEAELARLPSLDAFTLKTDLAPFMRKGVPHALRNAALRKMWMLDPAIRDHQDLARDYAWDWNTPGGVPGNAGTISRDSLARMLESLNPRPADPEAVGSKPAESSPGAAEQETARAPDAGDAAEGAEAEAHPPTPQGPAEASAPQETEPAREADRTADRTVRPRRHGGAAPV